MLTAEHLRRRGLSPRRRLLHVLGSNRISSMPMFCLELIQVLPDYAHTVLCQADVEDIDRTWMWSVQVTGAELLHSDWRRTEHVPSSLSKACSAVIMYDTWINVIGSTPTIYYRYNSDVDDSCVSAVISPRGELSMPPAIRSRAFRGVRRDASNPKFTVSVLSSGREDRYPITLIQYLARHLDADIRLVVSEPGARPLDTAGHDVWRLPIMIDAPLKGLQMSDVAVYAHEPLRCPEHTPYGRLCAELVASGVPVVCERVGAPARMYQEGTHVLFFNEPEEALAGIETLRHNPDLRESLRASGQLIGSQQDISVHLGMFRDILRSVGA